jgi:hypothetical protein
MLSFWPIGTGRSRRASCVRAELDGERVEDRLNIRTPANTPACGAFVPATHTASCVYASTLGPSATRAA